MALVAGGLALAGTAATIIAQQQQAKAAQKAAAMAGAKPNAVEIKPVDFGLEQGKTIFNNMLNMRGISQLGRMANDTLTGADLRRANRFMPGFTSMMRTQAMNAGDLINGRLPYDDVMDIVSNRSGMAGQMGVPGLSGPATLRDLGMSRLQAITSGQGLLQNMVQTAETVSPISRYTRPADFLLSPQQTIPWAIQQAQLVQGSGQSAANIRAGASPAELAAAAGMASGATNPWAGIGTSVTSLAPYANDIWNPTGAGGSGGFQSYAAASKSAPYAAGVSFNPDIGYSPTALGTGRRYSIPAV